MSDETKICTLNVKGLGDSRKRNQIFHWLKENKYDICFLQEVHCKSKDTDKWANYWGSEIFLSGNSSNSAGVAILLNKPYEVIKHTEILVGRLQALSIEINDTEVILLNIYGPNNNDKTFFEQLETFIAENDDKTFIIGGDFNVVLNTNLDKKNGRNETNEHNRNKLFRLIENYDLVDIWRVLHPDSKQFTWHSNSRPPIFCRLDYFLVSTNISNRIKKSNITTNIRSDHSLVYLVLETTKQRRGPGYFKMNNSVLTEEAYQIKIRKAI